MQGVLTEKSGFSGKREINARVKQCSPALLWTCPLDNVRVGQGVCDQINI